MLKITDSTGMKFEAGGDIPKSDRTANILTDVCKP